MSSEQNFWSRRKALVAAELDAEEASIEADELALAQVELEEKSDAEILEELGLPDPDSLEMGSDFSVFMGKAVPDRIRRKALRVLWRSNPVLANVDMLVDYGEDFTDKATVIENMQTAYQVGKGMLKHVEEMARQAEALEHQDEPEVLDEEEEDLDQIVAEADLDEASEDYVELDEPEEEPLATPAPRRMKFRIEDAA